MTEIKFIKKIIKKSLNSCIKFICVGPTILSDAQEIYRKHADHPTLLVKFKFNRNRHHLRILYFILSMCLSVLLYFVLFIIIKLYNYYNKSPYSSTKQNYSV